MSATGEEDPMDLGDDLFGDDEEQEEVVEKARELDDEELDSGDDQGRHDRDAEAMEDGVQDTEMDDAPVPEINIMGSTIPRHNIPKPSDGELNTLKIPPFLSIAPKWYDEATYNIPTADHHSNTKSEKFSACDTAMTTIRYRKNPNTGKLESNTLLYRWSDGSMTMQVGDHHYEVASKQLSQPKTMKYKPEFDSNIYLTSAHIETNQVLQIVGHVSNQISVRPPPEMEDDALERLQERMAAATRGRTLGDSKKNMVETTQDPELQKKQAELAEKERLKLQRKRETAAAKATQQVGRGLRTTASGLSIGDLEGGRGSTKKAPKNKPRRNRYDDSDDDRPRGRGNQDEYDREDGFLASSDEEEEPEAEDDEDEEEEMIDGDSDKEVSNSKRGKKARDEDSDLDADGEVDPDAPTTTAAEVTVPRGKRRNIIEDDDDE